MFAHFDSKNWSLKSNEMRHDELIWKSILGMLPVERWCKTRPFVWFKLKSNFAACPAAFVVLMKQILIQIHLILQSTFELLNQTKLQSETPSKSNEWYKANQSKVSYRKVQERLNEIHWGIWSCSKGWQFYCCFLNKPIILNGSVCIRNSTQKSMESA